MNTKKARDLKIQVAEGIKTLEASVTVVRAADNVAEIKVGDSLNQKINATMPLTPELLEIMTKKVKDLLNEQSSAIKASGDSQFEGFVTRGIESRFIAIATSGSTISLNKDYLAGQQDKATIIHNIENINIYQGDEQHTNQSVITEEDIKKLTPTQLSCGAWLWILGLLTATAIASFKFGYHYREITHPSVISNQEASLEQLSSYQIALLKEIYKYQKIIGVNKVVILKTGIIVDEATNKNTSINIAVNVLGYRANQTSFEDLIISMPEYFLKRLPATRWDEPYVLTVTEGARKILDRNS